MAVRVCFLWHMHQPWYVDLRSGRPGLPWVRLHALKDYLDIPALAAEFPKLRQTFNWVPGLLDQVALAGEDEHRRLATRPIAQLTAEERAFLVREFFSIGDREINVIPGYSDLKERLAIDPAASDEDLERLRVAFHLAWSGDLLREELPDGLRIDLTAEERVRFYEVQDRWTRELLPRLGRLIEEQAIAVTTSPYHHPILPLLIEPRAALVGDPGLELPAGLAPRPDDARWHLRAGFAAAEQHLGTRPRGLWPPEGAVGPATLGLLAEEGVEWVVTDEEILTRSLGGDVDPEAILTPWRFAGVDLFFRERELSDRIGFVYSHWDADEAAADFVHRLETRASGVDDAVITVALDGENAWENYDDSGRPFLRTLFALLSEKSEIEVVDFETARGAVEPRPLDRLHCGSWINADLRTWIGEPTKNRAWEVLASVASELDRVIDGVPPTPLTEAIGDGHDDAGGARAALMAAQASDWFWWFGEGHSSAHDADFDQLFRGHLAEALRRAGIAIPAALALPVIGDGPPRPSSARAPASLLAPTLDGRATDYYEWLAAGRVDAGSDGAMHFGATRFRSLEYGTDRRSLYLRLDPVEPPARRRIVDLGLEVVVAEPVAVTTRLPFSAEDPDGTSAVAVVDRIVEARLPLADAGLEAGTVVRFRVDLRDDAGRLVQRLPADGWVEVEIARPDW